MFDFTHIFLQILAGDGSRSLLSSQKFSIDCVVIYKCSFHFSDLILSHLFILMWHFVSERLSNIIKMISNLATILFEKNFVIQNQIENMFFFSYIMKKLMKNECHRRKYPDLSCFHTKNEEIFAIFAPEISTFDAADMA